MLAVATELPVRSDEAVLDHGSVELHDLRAAIEPAAVEFPDFVRVAVARVHEALAIRAETELEDVAEWRQG